MFKTGTAARNLFKNFLNGLESTESFRFARKTKQNKTIFTKQKGNFKASINELVTYRTLRKFF